MEHTRSDADQLLDCLDTLPLPDEHGWMVRSSSTGRGWRLLTTSQQPHYRTATEALRAFREARERGNLRVMAGE